MHLTLAFLGALPAERLSEVGAAVGAAALGEAPFTATFDRLGRFPPDGRPSTIWLGLGVGSASVERLTTALRAELGRRALDFDRKAARPHVTLARGRPDATAIVARAIAVAIERARVPDLRFEVRELAVIESVLTGRGPRYAVCASVPLEESGEH